MIRGNSKMAPERRSLWMRRILFLCALLVACGSKPKPDTIPTTYRLIAGVSMGGIGASVLGLRHPDMFDGVGPLGGPLDAAFYMRVMEQFWLGGFCSRAQLEAIMAQNPNNPNALNDPNIVGVCMKAAPATVPNEHSESYSHWQFTTNGGTVNRDYYLSAFY